MSLSLSLSNVVCVVNSFFGGSSCSVFLFAFSFLLFWTVWNPSLSRLLVFVDCYIHFNVRDVFVDFSVWSCFSRIMSESLNALAPPPLPHEFGSGAGIVSSLTFKIGHSVRKCDFSLQIEQIGVLSWLGYFTIILFPFINRVVGISFVRHLKVIVRTPLYISVPLNLCRSTKLSLNIP